MAERITARSIIKSSLITAFTIAAALIWKDVISDFIAQIIPAKQEFFYEVVAALIATAVIVIIIFVIIETESEAEEFIERVKKKQASARKKR